MFFRCAMAAHNNVMAADSLLARIQASRVNLILAALGFAPLLGLFFVMSWDRPAYQFFPLALAGAAILGWRALREQKLEDGRSKMGEPRTGIGNLASAPTPLSDLRPPTSDLRPPTSDLGPLTSALRPPPSALRPPPPARALGVGLAAAAGLLFLLANCLWSPWLGYVSFLLAATALLWRLGGLPLVKAFVPAGFILLTILPPPLNGDVTLTVWLRTVAVHISSTLLDWLQVTHAQDGNTLLLPGKTLLVEEACSGINSFILCNSLCLFWGLWQRRSLWWFAFALSATSSFVVLGNIIRITAGAAAFYFRHFDLLSGRPHEIFGLILLIGYCILIWSFDQLLVFFTDSGRAQKKTTDNGTTAYGPPTSILPAPPDLRPPPSDLGPPTSDLGPRTSDLRPPPSDLRPPPPALGPRTSVLRPPPSLPLLFSLIGLGFFAAHLFLGGRHGLAKLPSLGSVRELNLSLPTNLAGWQRVNGVAGDLAWVQTFGLRSADWQFEHNGLKATVAADYPLEGFHNVKGCYLGNGWQVLSEKELLQPPAGDDLHAIKLELQKSLQYAVVLHSVMNGQGVWLSAPTTVSSRFADTVGPPQTGYRIQMITAGYGPLSPAAEADCQALFLQARQALVKQLLDQLRSPAAK